MRGPSEAATGLVFVFALYRFLSRFCENTRYDILATRPNFSRSRVWIRVPREAKRKRATFERNRLSEQD